MLFLERSLMMVPTCRDRIVKKQSTISLLTSANKTLWLFVSIRSFKLTLGLEVAAILN